MANLKKRNGRWTFTYTGADGQTKRRVGFTDKAETARLARRLEDDARKRRLGLVDESAERMAGHARRPIADHVEAYKAHLESKGGTAGHIRATVQNIERVAEACEWATLSDMDGARLSAHLRDYAAQGKSARTVNWRRGSVKSFARWLVAHDRLSRDPLAGVARAAEHTPTRERRALGDDEISRLIEATERGPARFKMDGERRAMLYRAAIGTGLRAGELASLTPRSFDLDADPPTVTVEAAYSKRRRRDVQPFRSDLADSLRPWLARQKPDEPLWRLLGRHASAMLKPDLGAAGVPVTDDAGRVADFHALRHTYITRLAKAGVSPKVAQTLARHSTITLTMDRYAHVGLADHKRALDALPALASNADPRTYSAQSDRPHGQSLSENSRETAAHAETDDAQNHRENKAKRSQEHGMSGSAAIAPLGFEPRTTPIMSRALYR